MFRKLSIGAKTALFISVAWVIFTAVQWLGFLAVVRTQLPETLAHGIAEADATFWMLFALSVGWFGPASVFLGSMFAHLLTRHRTKRFTRVLERIASGELLGPLEPSLDTDLAPVRQALDRMQRALHDVTSRLQHTDAQRRRLFGDLSHELATPIGTILAISEALTKPIVVEDPNERARLVAYLDREAARLERLIGDMRDLARLDEPDFALTRTRTDVAALVRDLSTNWSDATPSVVLDASEHAWAEVDAGRIEQVLTNLVSNARRYTPKEGRIVIVVREDEAGVALTVDDEGTGVPEDMLPRLGERMLRLDPSRNTATGGHGLGLAIVSAVVHQHNGTITFGTAPSGGLRVAIVLPPCVEAL